MGPTGDFYSLLNVPRTADEREIKKAYFRLVRRFPPETHPEEFERLREAYEVLSNAPSRREYDQVSQYGEHFARGLRAGMEAMDRCDLQTAQAEFRKVLAGSPDLHYARDLLGMACLNNNQPREALRHFDELLRSGAATATHCLHKGYAHYALDQYPQAVAAYEQALGLDGRDARVLVALCDCYTAMERYEEALAALDRAIHMDDELDFQDIVLLMRRVQIQLLRDRADLAEQEIDELRRVLPRDAEVRKYVTQKLLSLASQLFRIKRSADGNRVLARAQEFGERRNRFTFPARFTCKAADLPPASQEKLAQLARTPAPYKLTYASFPGLLLLGLLSLTMLLGPLGQALGSQREWHGDTLAFLGALLLLAPLLCVYTLRRTAQVLRSPLGRFTTIHPLYLLQVDIDEVSAWPLCNLHDVSMTHHLQNGVYQYTAVKLDFAGSALVLTLRGQQAAVDWAQALLDARQRCLGLLSVGLLEELEGHDLLPPDLLGQRPAHATFGRCRSRRRARWALLHYVAAGAVGVGLLHLGIQLNRHAAAAFDHAGPGWRSPHSFGLGL